MTVKNTLTAERLRELLDYDPLTGIFVWKIRPSQRTFAGDVAGMPVKSGHWRIKIDRYSHLAHRLAWLHVYGEWPSEHLDHRNGLPNDNRITNLRLATHAQNLQNIHRARRNSRSGILGAQPRESGRFRARIHFDGKTVNLGTFDTAEEASAAYLAAKQVHHPFYTAC